jgi:hypothetical protein
MCLKSQSHTTIQKVTSNQKLLLFFFYLMWDISPSLNSEIKFCLQGFEENPEPNLSIHSLKTD